MKLKSEAVVRRCSVKKVVPKNFKSFSGKHPCQSQESLVKAISCEFCGIFKNIYLQNFCERILVWNEAMKKWRWYPLKCSCKFEGWEHEYWHFYWKVAQSLIFSSKICEVLQSFCFVEHYLILGNYFWFPPTFLTFHFLYQQFRNSVSTSCLGTPETCASDPH